MAKSTKTTRKEQVRKTSPSVIAAKSKKPFRTYNEAIKYLFERTDYEKERSLRYNVTTFDLSRMENYCRCWVNHTKKSVQPI